MKINFKRSINFGGLHYKSNLSREVCHSRPDSPRRSLRRSLGRESIPMRFAIGTIFPGLRRAGMGMREEGLPIGNINYTSRTGITLVEVVVAAFILILSLTALLLLFSRTMHSAEAARRHLQALQVARTELEQFRSTNYLNITSYPAVLLADSFFVPLAGTKQCSVVTTNNYKEITMTIRWKSLPKSQLVTQTFYTIICSTN